MRSTIPEPPSAPPISSGKERQGGVDKPIRWSASPTLTELKMPISDFNLASGSSRSVRKYSTNNYQSHETSRFITRNRLWEMDVCLQTTVLLARPGRVSLTITKSHQYQRSLCLNGPLSWKSAWAIFNILSAISKSCSGEFTL